MNWPELTPCKHCGYDQAGERKKKLDQMYYKAVENPTVFASRDMLLVDELVQDDRGNWGVWRGGQFYRGGGVVPMDPYWVCAHCQRSNERIHFIEKR